MFVYLRDKKAEGANAMRVMHNSPMLLERNNGEQVPLPEGASIKEVRMANDYRYDVVDFQTWWQSRNPQDRLVWRGLEGDMYPEAPEGTFFAEYALESPAGTIYQVALVSIETGQPVEDQTLAQEVMKSREPKEDVSHETEVAEESLPESAE